MSGVPHLNTSAIGPSLGRFPERTRNQRAGSANNKSRSTRERSHSPYRGCAMNSVIFNEDNDLTRQAEIERLERNVRRRLGANVRNFRLVVRANGLILLGHASTYYA